MDVAKKVIQKVAKATYFGQIMQIQKDAKKKTE